MCNLRLIPVGVRVLAVWPTRAHTKRPRKLLDTFGVASAAGISGYQQEQEKEQQAEQPEHREQAERPQQQQQQQEEEEEQQQQQQEEEANENKTKKINGNTRTTLAKRWPVGGH